MPRTEVIFFQERPSKVPVLAWLDKLQRKDRKAYAKCLARIGDLAQMGHELRRPRAATLRDGIHELRIGQGGVLYRLLYSFHGQNVALLTHALTKEKKVPDRDIERAIQRKRLYEKDPVAHRYREPRGDQ